MNIHSWTCPKCDKAPVWYTPPLPFLEAENQIGIKIWMWCTDSSGCGFFNEFVGIYDWYYDDLAELLKKEGHDIREDLKYVKKSWLLERFY